jgi:hypothetical protein
MQEEFSTLVCMGGTALFDLSLWRVNYVLDPASISVLALESIVLAQCLIFGVMWIPVALGEYSSRLNQSDIITVLGTKLTFFLASVMLI